MRDTPSPEKWGKAPFTDDSDPARRPLQTIQSKFLDAVRSYAEQRYLELVVDFETPNNGYAYIQKKEGFSNLYSFHFEFSSESATFYLGTEKVATVGPEQRRGVQFSGGAQLDEVLAEICAGIDSASKLVFPALAALSANRDPIAETPLGSLQIPAVTARDSSADHREAAGVWGQGEKGTRAEARASYLRGSHRRAIAVALVLIAMGFLVFVPVLRVPWSVAGCPYPLGSCPSSAPYYVSVTNHSFGVGGEYLPPGQGWTLHEFFGVHGEGTGSTAYGFAAWYYYFAT